MTVMMTMQKKIKMLFAFGTILFLVGLIANNLTTTNMTSQKQLPDKLLEKQPKTSASPSIISIRPVSAFYYTAGSTIDIIWNCTGYVPYVTLQLQLSGSPNGTIYTAPSLSTESNIYHWHVPSYQYPSNQYRIYFYWNISVYQWSETFTIHGAGSWIRVTNPISGTWIAGSSHYINWTTNSTNLHVNLTLFDNSLYKSTIVQNAANNGAYYWHLPSTLPTDYSYQVEAAILSVNDTGTVFSIIGNPTITAPADITYNLGATGHSISWTVTDTSYGVRGYTVYRNGTSVATGSWTNNTAVTISVDGLATGSYNYTIVATNGLDGASSDTVIVTVVGAGTTPGVPFDGYTFLIIMLLSVGGLVAWSLKKRIARA